MNVNPLSSDTLSGVAWLNPAADDVAAPLPEEPVEHPVAAAHDGLVVDLNRRIRREA